LKDKQREGVLVTPRCRLSDEQVRLVDEVSRELLQDPGLLCSHEEVIGSFRAAGATIEEAEAGARIRIPASIIDQALEAAPSTVVLGARNPDNRLVLDAAEPRARFVSGANTVRIEPIDAKQLNNKRVIW
jgi:trimethylamine--corrinoid protein Co-methyltransferase